MKRVICVKSCLLVVITILASFSVSIVSVNSSNNSEQAFITHNPIIINGNSEFLSFVSSDSLSGSGTSNDPYIVENLLLNSSSDIQISIKNVDLYFIIQNNIIENGNKQGILLDTVSNAIIKGNQLSDNTGDAINVIDSSNIIISNNLIQNTKGTSTSLNKYGRVDFPFTMDIAYSDNILVEKNTLNHNYDGIWFWLNTNNSIMRENIVNGSTTFEGLGIGGLGAHDDIVEDNIVTNITRYAIWSYSANNSIIKNNSIAKAVDGIRIDASKFLDIRNNTVENTNTYGINLQIGSYNNTVARNTVKDSMTAGIKINGYNNSINYNLFINNTVNGYDASTGEINYCSYNYWSDATGNDANNDGILDQPYKLGGFGGLTDPTPLAKPIIPQETSSNTSTTSETVSASFSFINIFLLVGILVLLPIIVRKRKLI